MYSSMNGSLRVEDVRKCQEIVLKERRFNFLESKEEVDTGGSNKIWPNNVSGAGYTFHLLHSILLNLSLQS